MYQPHGYLLIGGAQIQPEERVSLPIINPATEEEVGVVARATIPDIDAAVDATRAGFERWRRSTGQERAVVLAGAAATIRSRRQELACLVTTELGKPMAESLLEADGAAAMFDWAAGESGRGYGQTVPGPADERRIVVREPIGPAIALTPWNAPAVTPSRKIGYALAAGCSLLLKPSEETPSAALFLAEALRENGLPDGVLNVLFGDPQQISRRAIESEVCRILTFTGSIPVGKQLSETCARQMMTVVMELGGHAPVVVFDDVDVDKVAAAAVAGKFRNSGQVCLSPTRFLIHEKLHDQFASRFAEFARAWQVGDPREEGTQMGPVKNARQKANMARLVGDAVARGAEVLVGGEEIAGKGYFWKPTVLTGTTPDSEIENSEPFGPIATVTPFEGVDQALAMANRLPYALAAYAFTNNGKNAKAFADGIEAGVVGINHWKVTSPETPFGGVKESGIGREGGHEGVAAFQRVKYLTEKW